VSISPLARREQIASAENFRDAVATLAAHHVQLENGTDRNEKQYAKPFQMDVMEKLDHRTVY
jgi:hypothetical protein